jgi:SlyX protein
MSLNDKQWESRLETLESKLAFQDDTIDILNKTIISQERELKRMQTQFESLIKNLTVMAPTMLASQEEETRPPHY